MGMDSMAWVWVGRYVLSTKYDGGGAGIVSHQSKYPEKLLRACWGSAVV